MRARLATVLAVALLLALLLPATAPATPQDVAETVDTKVDVVDDLVPIDADQDGERTTDADAPTGGGEAPDPTDTSPPAADGPASSATGDAARTPEPVTTAPRQAPIRFSMLAFTAPRAATVEFRTSLDGVTWTPWTEAEGAEQVGPDPGTAEAAAAEADHRRSGEPSWVGDARWVQARVTGAAPEQLHVDVIDSMGLSRSLAERAGDALRAVARATTVGSAAHAEPPPKIVRRAAWGANEKLRSGTPIRAGKARYAVLHHTVNSNTYTRAQAKGIVRGIYAYHTTSRGWSDIGYNFLVDRFGTVYEGRAGGLTAAVVGAHALGFNTGSIGVAMIGDHERRAVSAATRRSLARLLAWQFAEHGITPRGSVRVTSACTGRCKHPNGRVLRLPTLSAHRDVGLTVCPGARGYRALPGLRRAIAKITVPVLSNPSVTPDPNTLTSSGLLDPLRAKVDVRPAGRWRLTLVDPRGRVVHRANGRGRFADVSWSGHGELRPGRYRYTFTGGRRTPETGTFRIRRAAYEPPFSDDDRSVHAAAIGLLYERGITRGCSKTKFCPQRKVRRDELASFIARTMDNLILFRPTSPTDHYTDDGSSSHERAINSLAEAGILTPCGPDRFCPTARATRGDAAVWLASAFTLPASSTDHFTDDDGRPEEDAINALAEAGITKGCGADRYCPDRAMSRGQLATLLARAINVLEAGGLGG